MKVQVTPKPERKDVLAVLLDDEDWCDIHISIFGKKPAFRSNYSTAEDFAEHFKELELQGAKRFILRRLSLHNMHTVEINSALEERLVDPKVIPELIEQFVEKGYVNDIEWVAGFVRRSIQQKQGPKAIKMKLKAKGITTTQIDSALTVYKSGDETKQNILKLINSRYRSRDLSDYKERQKVIAALARKGYDFADILAVFKDRSS